MCYRNNQKIETMGKRITQTIYTCDLCGNAPEDGEYLWYMGNQVWCEPCCDKVEKGELNPDY